MPIHKVFHQLLFLWKGRFHNFFYHLCFGVWDTLWSSFLLRRWFSGFDLCFSKILGSSTNCLRTIWGDDHSQKQLERQFLISTLIYHWWENSLKRHQSAKKLQDFLVGFKWFLGSKNSKKSLTFVLATEGIFLVFMAMSCFGFYDGVSMQMTMGSEWFCHTVLRCCRCFATHWTWEYRKLPLCTELKWLEKQKIHPS